MFSVTVRIEENFSKKKGPQTVECGRERRYRECFRVLRCKRVRAAETEPSLKMQSLGRKGALWFPVPPCGHLISSHQTLRLLSLPLHFPLSLPTFECQSHLSHAHKQCLISVVDLRALISLPLFVAMKDLIVEF